MKTFLHEREVREEGIRIGIEQGIEQGQMERLRMNIRSMLGKGMQVEDVAFYLEISEDDVRNIENEMKKAE